MYEQRTKQDLQVIETLKAILPIQTKFMIERELLLLLDVVRHQKGRPLSVSKVSFRVFNYLNTSGIILIDKALLDAYNRDKSMFKIPFEKLPQVLLCNAEYNTVEHVEEIIKTIQENYLK